MAISGVPAAALRLAVFGSLAAFALSACAAAPTAQIPVLSRVPSALHGQAPIASGSDLRLSGEKLSSGNASVTCNRATSGGYSLRPRRQVYRWTSFDVRDGVAQGPWPGTFAATGSWTRNHLGHRAFTESFTIHSGTRTLRGHFNDTSEELPDCHTFVAKIRYSANGLRDGTATVRIYGSTNSFDERFH
jgi:hypothetical protein